MTSSAPPNPGGDDSVWLSDAELNTIQESALREKVAQLQLRCRRTVDGETALKRSTALLEQEMHETLLKLSEATEELENQRRGQDEARERLDSIERDRNEKVRQLYNAEAERDSALTERNSLNRQVHDFTSEKDSLLKVIQRNTGEIERQRAEITGLEQKVESVMVEKCKAMLELDEIKNREMSVEYREKRFEQEKQLWENEKRWYSEELSNRDRQIHSLRRDQVQESLSNDSKVTEMQDTIDDVRFKLDDYATKNEALTKQIEDLNNKLRQTVDEKSSERLSLENEIECQEKLADMNKDSATKAEAKVAELAEALSNLQQLFEDSKKSHFDMQETLRSTESKLQNQIDERDKEVAELRDELEKANELLRSKHRVMLTDEEVAALSPGAAAASRLIRGSGSAGLSLTGIYRDHCRVVEELETQKQETRRVQLYFDELVKDIEQKAPGIRRQREEYRTALDTIQNLRTQIHSVNEVQTETFTGKQRVERQLVYTSAELERCQRDNADLSKQVRHLLQCLEKLRTDGGTSLNEISSTTYSADAPLFSMDQSGNDTSVLPTVEDLFLFRSIDELQATNQKLMSELRQAQTKREEMVKAAQKTEMEAVLAELELVKTDLASFHTHRDKQNSVIETLEHQRDGYKRLMEQTLVDNQRLHKQHNGDIADGQLNQTAIGGKTANSTTNDGASYERLNKEFEAYRNEKMETEKTMIAKTDQLQSQLGELKATNAKLNSEVEYQNERFKVLNSNYEGYRREIESLKERLHKSGINVAKQEEKLATVTKELFATREEMSTMKVENRSLHDHLSLSKASERRLQSELEALRREGKNQETLSLTLQELQARLDRQEEERVSRYRREGEQMRMERDALQHTINSLSDQQQEYVTEAKAKQRTLQMELEQANAKAERIEGQLTFSEKRLSETEQKCTQLQQRLDQFTHGTAGGRDASSDRFQKEAQQLQTRLTYVEMQHAETVRKLEDAQEKLKRNQAEIDRYTTVTSTMESSLNEQRQLDTVERTRLDTEIHSLKGQVEAASELATSMNKEAIELRAQIQQYYDDAAKKEVEWSEQVSILETDLEKSKQETASFHQREVLAVQDRDRISAVAKSYEEKFAESDKRCSELLTNIEALRSSIAVTTDERDSATERATRLDGELIKQKITFECQYSDLKAEMEKYKTRNDELNRKNEELYEQLTKLGNELAVLEQMGARGASGISGVPSEPVGDFSSESLPVSTSSESASSLMEVIRYLREERSAAGRRADAVENELVASKTRHETLEVELDRIRAQLADALKKTETMDEVLADKSRLAVRLRNLEAVQETNVQLEKDRAEMESKIVEMTTKLHEANKQLSEGTSRNESLAKVLTQSQQSLTAAKKEADAWKLRHTQLTSQRAAFNPRQLTQLRADIDAVRAELSDTKTQLENAAEERDRNASQLADLKQTFEAVSLDKAQKEKILGQARALARNYKTKFETANAELITTRARVNELSVELEKQKAAAGAPPDPSAADQQQSLLPASGGQIDGDNSADYRTLKSKYDTLAKAYQDMKAKHDPLANEFHLLKSRVAPVEENLKLATKSASEMAEKLITLKQENGFLKQEVDRLQTEVETNATVNMRLKALSSMTENQKQGFEKAQADVIRLTAEKEALQTQLRELQQQKQQQRNLATVPAIPISAATLATTSATPAASSSAAVPATGVVSTQSASDLTPQEAAAARSARFGKRAVVTPRTAESVAAVRPTVAAGSGRLPRRQVAILPQQPDQSATSASPVAVVQQQPQQQPSQPMTTSSTTAAGSSCSSHGGSLPQAVVQPRFEQQQQHTSQQQQLATLVLPTRHEDREQERQVSGSTDVVATTGGIIGLSGGPISSSSNSNNGTSVVASSSTVISSSMAGAIRLQQRAAATATVHGEAEAAGSQDIGRTESNPVDQVRNTSLGLKRLRQPDDSPSSPSGSGAKRQALEQQAQQVSTSGMKRDGTVDYYDDDEQRVDASLPFVEPSADDDGQPTATLDEDNDDIDDEGEHDALIIEHGEAVAAQEGGDSLPPTDGDDDAEDVEMLPASSDGISDRRLLLPSDVLDQGSSGQSDRLMLEEEALDEELERNQQQNEPDASDGNEMMAGGVAFRGDVEGGGDELDTSQSSSAVEADEDDENDQSIGSAERGDDDADEVEDEEEEDSMLDDEEVDDEGEETDVEDEQEFQLAHQLAADHQQQDEDDDDIQARRLTRHAEIQILDDDEDSTNIGTNAVSSAALPAVRPTHFTTASSMMSSAPLASSSSALFVASSESDRAVPGTPTLPAPVSSAIPPLLPSSVPQISFSAVAASDSGITSSDVPPLTFQGALFGEASQLQGRLVPGSREPSPGVVAITLDAAEDDGEAVDELEDTGAGDAVVVESSFYDDDEQPEGDVVGDDQPEAPDEEDDDDPEALTAIGGDEDDEEQAAVASTSSGIRQSSVTTTEIPSFVAASSSNEEQQQRPGIIRLKKPTRVPIEAPSSSEVAEPTVAVRRRRGTGTARRSRGGTFRGFGRGTGPHHVELVEKAKNGNVIVPLGTGSGKTFIAIMLIKDMATEMRLPPPHRKRAVFLVDKVALVQQQAEQIENHTNLKVGQFHGQVRGLDPWNKEQLDAEIDDKHVLVMTAQIFLDMIMHAYLELKTVNLIVFDECHHGLGAKHPYREIARQFASLPTRLRPKILGLTASIVNSKIASEKLEGKMNLLEQIYQARIETASDVVTVASYGARPKEITVVCRSFVETSGVERAQAEAWLKKALHFCQNANFDSKYDVDPTKPVVEALTKTLVALNQLGPWAAAMACDTWDKQLQKLKTSIMTDMQSSFIDMGRTYFMAARVILTRAIGRLETMDALVKVVPDKVLRLLEIIKALRAEHKHSRTEDNFTALVFVEQRYTAYMLKKILDLAIKLDKENLGFLRIDFIVGHHGYNLPSDEHQAILKRQEDVLRMFRRCERNLLVSTNVLEEGIDIRQCNVVVRFDRPRDFRSYVQSKGRARKKDSFYFVLVEEHEAATFAKDQISYRKIEELLLKRRSNADNPSAEEGEGVDYENLDSVITPYEVSVDGTDTGKTAKVSMATAIALVNNDIFTKLVPRCSITPVIVNGIEVGYHASLLLPINSPVKKLIKTKEPLPRKKLAQMAVALATCEELHKQNELDNHLLPIGKQSVLQFLQQLQDDVDGEWSRLIGAHVRPGSAKRKQYYDKQWPKALNRAFPMPNANCYIHEINVCLKTLSSSNIDLFDSQRTFGILSSKPLPKIPAFPLYCRQGEVVVEVRPPVLINITPDQVPTIAKFHECIFSGILHDDRYGMRFSYNDSPTSIFIVPVQKTSVNGLILDWKFCTHIIDGLRDVPRAKTHNEQEKFTFEPSRYKDAIVMPWYRNQDQPQCFVVSSINYDLSPLSPFPDGNYKSYVEYFDKKYDLNVHNHTQPLLTVDYTSQRLNHLTRCERKQPSSTQMVPELVDVHPMPASLWNVVVLLPSALYRVNHLLLADEFRVMVESDAFGRQSADTVFVDRCRWQPLDYRLEERNRAIAEASAIAQMSRRPNDLAPKRRRLDDDAQTAAPKCPRRSSSNDNTVDSTFHEPRGIDDLDIASGDWMKPSGSLNLVTHTATGNNDDENAVSGGADGLTTFTASIQMDDCDNEDEEDAIIFNIRLNQCGSVTPSNTAGGTHSSSENKPNATATETTSNGDAMDADGGERDSSDESNLEDSDRRELEEVLKESDLAEGDTDEDLSSNIATEGGDDTMEQDEMNPEDVAVEWEKEKEKSRVCGPIASELKDPMTYKFEENNFDEHPFGPSPCLILQALTMYSASDGINLERLETVGDSFLKYAVTLYLFHELKAMHEGKLSLARSKQISNYNLYKLGKKLGIPQLMVTTKFDPHANWLPPCYQPTNEFKTRNEEDVEEEDRHLEDVLEGKENVDAKLCQATGWDEPTAAEDARCRRVAEAAVEKVDLTKEKKLNGDDDYIPPSYNMMTQQSVSDKAIADAVEALIGVYLLTYGPHHAMRFMNWAGITVFPKKAGDGRDWSWAEEAAKHQPLLHYEENPERQLDLIWVNRGFSQLEETIGYKFHNRAYLVQAFTHASYYENRITDCYQRLEFLGDAVLDYMITQHLYEDRRQHWPGVLTDLRSALVNNTIFASLALKYNFQSYFLATCPDLHNIIGKFVRENKVDATKFNEGLYMLTEEECAEGDEKDIEVPKAMGDMFESVAGAIFLDSGCSLYTVWRVFYQLMGEQIDTCQRNPPKSPIRELMEMEPDNVRFTKLERNVETGKVRVTVDIRNQRHFVGQGRNYRIAKCTAAKLALRYLKSLNAQQQ